MTPWFLVSSISENILTNLTNFFGHHNSILLKNIDFSNSNRNIHYVHSLLHILYWQSTLICLFTIIVSSKLTCTHICKKHSLHGDAHLKCLWTLYYMPAPKAGLTPALLGPPPGLHSSADSTNGIQAWLDGSHSAATPPPAPIPDPNIKPFPPISSVYDQLLVQAGEGRWPVRKEDEYIPLTAWSPCILGEPANSCLDNHSSWHYQSHCCFW